MAKLTPSGRQSIAAAVAAFTSRILRPPIDPEVSTTIISARPGSTPCSSPAPLPLARGGCDGPLPVLPRADRADAYRDVVLSPGLEGRLGQRTGQPDGV